jgi:phosphoribosyl-ATP pyrophosphohydrolase
LGALNRTLQARVASAPPGSYTARLLADPALLRAKLMEEAAELMAASSPGAVAAEAADLLYFTLVAAACGGADLPAIEQVLDRRALRTTRRKGDAKPPPPLPPALLSGGAS